jgi:hypothetical protein
MTVAALLASSGATPAFAQEPRVPTLRFGYTSGWNYDGRDDSRDFPRNGFFPGNFAADPGSAAIGAAGIFDSNPWRSATPYPSQVIFGPGRPQAYCSRNHRSHERSSGTFVGNDGTRHRC